MTAAVCWDAAATDLPSDVQNALEEAGSPALAKLKLLAALPETRRVRLPLREKLTYGSPDLT
jgi:hypothetical protein